MTAIQDIPVKSIGGEETSLRAFEGSVVLVVNVASKCGLTPQYSALEALYEANEPRGFTILGFPCNQFLGQEPGSDAEIASFCETKYGVRFPLFAKIDVNGPGRHPLYAALTGAVPEAQTAPGSTMREKLASHGVQPREGEILWNFEKFLVGRDGSVLARFAPDVPPDDPMVTEAVERALDA